MAPAHVRARAQRLCVARPVRKPSQENRMLTEKTTLTAEELDDQFALELPARDTMLVTIVITNVLNNLTVEVDVRNVNVAAQICAQLIATGNFTCEIQQ
jgi:hypothetical protein